MMARRERYIFAEEPRRGRGFLIGLSVVMLLAAAVVFVANFAMNHTVVFTKEYATISNLPSDLENFTILHISDLNGASIGDKQSAVENALGSRTASCVVFSGNMLDETGDVQPLLDLAAVMPRSTPIYYLPDGDPSVYASSGEVVDSLYTAQAQRLQRAGIIILDKPEKIVKGKNTLWLIPETLYTLDLDSSEKEWQSRLDKLTAQGGQTAADVSALRQAELQLERYSQIRAAISEIGKNDIQVAVTHLPLTKESVARDKAMSEESTRFSIHNVSLVLAGGTAGGQWRLPGIGAIWAPEEGFFPEDITLRGIGYLLGVRQHISPGLGVSDDYPLLRFRLFNSPEMTLLVLTSSLH